MKKGLLLILTVFLAVGADAQNYNHITVIDTNFEDGKLGG